MKNLGSIGSLILAMLAGIGVFSVCYWTASRVRESASNHPVDQLAWVCREFQLTEAETDRIRTLHEGYRPKCEEMCVRIQAKNRELADALLGATNIGPGIEQKLAEVANLRADCQAQMLRHFQEVARTMPSEQGARYLSEMQRLTLGLHSPMEDAMSESPHHEHP
ncbi:MAG: periplasmic heavy metal sensor [Opitutaceae bacterium]